MRQRLDPVVVCGAGAAGLAAALAAARAGAAVWLVEAAPQPGGTVAGTLIHTLGGLYDSAGEFLNGGLAEELARRLAEADPAVRRRKIGRTWVLSACPEVYRRVVRRWVEAEPRVTVLCGTRVSRVIRSGSEVEELEATGAQGPRLLPCRAVIDATGSAEVVRLIDPALVEDDPGRAAGGLIFTLRGAAPGALGFPKGVALVRALRAAAAEGTLPPECGQAWLDAGVYEDEVYVKLAVALPLDREDRGAWEEVTRRALNGRAAVVAFLSRRPEFAQAVLARTGCLGVRDGGRVRGEYRLTGEDVRQGRKFTDAACRCAWPIEFWDPQSSVCLEYLPEGGWYEVPLRCLKVRGLRNVWAAGKCLSADRHAQASARVAGCCWSMGEGAGRAAAGL